jgi:thiol:disulfide interchange protein DsbD
VVFALIGKRSGSLLSDPVVVIPIVLLYVVLAASMFGAFELQLPSSVQQKLSSVSGDGAAGAFGMGLVGGFTAAPCTGPFLLGILGYVTQTKDVVVGSTLLFTYALGMGVLFWVLAAFAVALPKSGRWMEWMKSVGGIALVVAGIHFLKPIVPAIERLVHAADLVPGAAVVAPWPAWPLARSTCRSTTPGASACARAPPSRSPWSA